MKHENKEKELEINYQNCVIPYLENFIKVVVPEDRINTIKMHITDIIKAKKNEKHHKYDCHKEEKRWFTGFCGEVAIEELLNIEFVDFSVGKSADYHIPDLKKICLNVGIKTVEYGKFPIVPKNSYRPEIIILKHSDTYYYVCGFATIEILNKYQSDKLILSPELAKRGTKSGFYGFQYLRCFNNLESLKKIID